MSQYVEFFVKRDDVFIPVGSYSRNNPMYQALDFAPYEKITLLDEGNYNWGKEAFDREIENYKKMMKQVSSGNFKMPF